MYAQRTGMNASLEDGCYLLIRESEVQGFVDQHGIFMDREEALQIAKKAGQLNVDRIKTWPDDELFSEDLY